MHRPICRRKPQNQTAWSIFVVWIILNNFTGGDCLTEFSDTDTPDNALVNSVSGKLELSLRDFLADFFNHFMTKLYLHFDFAHNLYMILSIQAPTNSLLSYTGLEFGYDYYNPT